MGFRAIAPGVHISKRNKDHKVYPYLLRDLVIDRPNQVWATDITYIPMKKGFMYLTAVIDLYSRRVMNWSVSNSMDAELCKDLIEEAIADLVEYDDDYSLLRDLTRNNNTAYIYTNYGELESDLMRGDSLALEVLIKVLSEVRIGDEYEVRDNYDYTAYEEFSGNTTLDRTVSGDLEFRLQNDIDDEEVVAKIVKHIEDNV